MVCIEHRTTPGRGLACRAWCLRVTKELVSPNPNQRNERRGGSPWWLFWAALAVFGFAATAYFSGRERQYVDETVRLRRQLESDTVQLAEWQQAPAILNARRVIEASVPPAAANGPSARIFADFGRGVVLVASRLPPAPPGKIYAMWVSGPGQPPAAAGTFQPQNDGSAIHVVRNAAAAGPGATVTVTLEDAGGAERPSSAPVLSVSFPAGAPH